MKDKTIRRLLECLSKKKLLLAVMMVFAVFINIAAMCAPLLIGKAIDCMMALNKGWFTDIIKLICILAALYLFQSLITWFVSAMSHKLALSASLMLRNHVFTKITKLPLMYIDKTAPGDIINRVTNDIEAINEGLSFGIVQFISSVSAIFIALGFMLYLNVYVTLVAVFITPLCFLVGFFITKYGRKKFNLQADYVSSINGYTNEIISSFETVKAYSYEKNAFDRFNNMNKELYNVAWKGQFASALVNPSTRFVNNIAYVLVGIFSVVAVINGDLTAGGIASFLSYTSQFSKPINEISSITMQLQLATAAARRVFAFLDLTEEPADHPTCSLENFIGNIEFNHVSFSYVKNNPLIKDFSMCIPAGTKVAIVGPTGAGKTTMVNLIMRFFEPDSGSVLIDGIDIDTITRHDLRKNIGMVLQETWLFGGSVRDNIAYGNPNATDRDIEDAAVKSRADSFIKHLPMGYDTVINPDGGNLSSGQKQLIAIARVMVMNAPMIILDEATSNVDILTEIKIQKAFDELMKGKTSFVIAHRLSTIVNSDLILVMKDGDIVEYGNHQNLIKANGLYSSLYNSFDV